MNSMHTAIIHLEWWDDRTGRELLMEALRAARHWHIPETGIPLEPQVLDYVGSDWGEMDLWFTVQLEHPNAFRNFVEAVRMVPIRVKTAMCLPEGTQIPTDMRTAMDLVYAD